MARITLYQDGEMAMDVNTGIAPEEALENAKRIIEEKLEEIRGKKKKDYPIWEELEEIRGCCIDLCSEIGECGNWQARRGNQNIFIDEQHAKSALAMAKISQLMPYYGGRITDKEWLDVTLKKFVITKLIGKLDKWDTNIHPTFVAFHTRKQRDAFISREENIQLLKDYFMIN